MTDFSKLADEFLGAKTPGETVADTAQPLVSGLTRGVTATAGLPGDILKLAEIGTSYISNFLGGKDVDFDVPYVTPPTSSELNKLVGEYLGTYLTRPSKTAGGRVAQKTIELATPGGIVSRFTNPVLKEAGRRTAAIDAGAGFAGQTTRELTGSEELGDAVELTTSFAGLPGLAPNYATREAKQIVKEAERADPGLVQARAREQTARQQGIPITVTETVDSQTAGLRTGDILSQREAADRLGVDELRTSRIGTESQPSVVRRSVNQIIGRRFEPEDFASRVRETAKLILERAMKLRTEKTQEFFVRGERDPVRPESVEALVKKIDTAIERYGVNDPVGRGLEAIRNDLTSSRVPKSDDPLEGITTKKGYVDNAGSLYNIYRSFRERMELPADNPDRVTDAKTGIIKPILQQMRDIARASSPSVAEGHQRYVEISRDSVEPLSKGPIAALSKVQTPQAVFDFFSMEKNIGPKQFEIVAREISNANPRLFKEMAREWLHTSFERAAKPTLAQAGGVNFKAGAKFDVAVRGARGSDQREKFDMILTELADVNGVRSTRNAIHSGFTRLMDVLSRMGRLPDIGSQTAGRQEAFREAGQNITGLVNINNNVILRWFNEVVRKNEFGKLADALGTKGGIDALIKLGKERPTSKRIGGILAGLVTSSDVFLNDDE